MIRRVALPLVALCVALWSIWTLEGARAGLKITNTHVGQTPVSVMTDGGNGPAVVVAHGFAGSRQMMQGYALVLAQAGYTVHAFDFEGHGRHVVPMSGDVGSLDGTTRRLVEQTRRVVAAAREGDAPVALLGHSMATDVLVRVALEEPRIGPTVLLSAFSQAIDATHPQDLLLITGAWEPGLRDFALDAARMVDADATDGETVTAGSVRRAALIAPAVEHVAILQSRAGRAAALDWLDSFYGRESDIRTAPTGWAILGLLGAITVLFAPLSCLVPRIDDPARPLPARVFWTAVLVPAAVVPLVASLFDPSFLPVLVADYLGLHLALYGALQIGLLWYVGAHPPRLWRDALLLPRLGAALLLLVWALGVFGFALDRYGANFWPVGPRIGIIAALALGAVPFMLADAWLAWGAPVWQRIAARAAFLASLAAAVALDFEALFFLVMIAPVIVLFWLTFGTMGRAVTARAGPVPAGLALGLALAWALGVSFPMFQV